MLGKDVITGAIWGQSIADMACSCADFETGPPLDIRVNPTNERKVSATHAIFGTSGTQGTCDGFVHILPFRLSAPAQRRLRPAGSLARRAGDTGSVFSTLADH